MRFPTVMLLALCCWMVLVIFLHLDDMSVEIYDEARRAVSAAEMARGDAHWLVPTYNGAPDHWGTKPALLVLCQAFWMKIFGVGELAVRLPSALATLLLCGLMIWWGRRAWGGALAGAMGGLFVLCCWEFMGNHGARTGDFDAMLTLFLTAQVVAFHQWVASGKTKWLWAAGGAVFLAGLSKGIAGGFFLPGIGLWLLATTEGR
ncbi:MAG: glycosyltransferase family 39 protein, partial [Bacteroidota bacterium]